MIPFKRNELLAMELCEEIDWWKERANHYEKLYKEEVALNVQQTNERLDQAKKSVGFALQLALSVRDNEDGSISISKENRKHLADNLTTTNHD